MKLCLASTSDLVGENRNYLKNARFLLESFYYIKEWQMDILNSRELFLLDSGAFTFLNASKQKEINWKEYIDRYADFINKYDIKHFFELDIDSLVGYEQVKKYRDYLEEKTHKKCIPVWHKNRGLEEWIKLTRDYDYVALGGIVIREIKKTEYKHFTALLEIARKNKCKVHGLGFTNIKELKKYKFYSVDSTSWKSGGRFGTIYQFKNNEMTFMNHPQGMRAKSSNGYLAKIQLVNFLEWVKYQDYVYTHY